MLAPLLKLFQTNEPIIVSVRKIFAVSIRRASNYHLERPWTTTIIPDFKGTIQIEVVRETGTYEKDSEYWKAGETWEDYLVHVVGHGVNKKTGKAINFISKQTSL